MIVGESVRKSIDDFEAGELDSSVLHACNAVDGTAGKLAGGTHTGNRARYVGFLRDHYWLLEPMITPGINLVDTRFTNVPLPKHPQPDFADIAYEVFRCGHGHGDGLPAGFELLPAVATPGLTHLQLANGVLQLPDRLPFGLIAAAVLSPANKGQKAPDTYYFSLGDEKFIINEWWGREADFQPIAARYNQTRVKLQW